MSAVLSTALVMGALLGAAGAAVLLLRGRPINDPLLYALAALELGLLAQAVVGVVRLVGTDRDISAGLFVAYLVGALLVLPAGVVWAVGERSRWGSGVLVVACLVVPVLIVRMQQIWDPAGG